MKRWFSSALLMLFLLQPPLFADDDGEYLEHFPRDLSALNLTPRQQKEISTILEHNMEELEQIHKKRRKLRERLQTLFQKKSFDREAFERLLLDLKRRSVRIQTELFAQIHEVLTPTQRRKFSRQLEEWEIE
ncbi:Spy/CpxP family protein refolding chaperone [Nitratifractor sp.]